MSGGEIFGYGWREDTAVGRVLSVWIPGRPKTKGSLTVTNAARGLAQDTPASKRWRALMAYAARRAWEEPWALDGPVSVVAVFHLPVHPTKGEVWAGRVGDIDKLARNLLDALQDAQVFSDDVQVTRLLCEKVPAGERGPGLDLRVLVPE